METETLKWQLYKGTIIHINPWDSAKVATKENFITINNMQDHKKEWK